MYKKIVILTFIIISCSDSTVFAQADEGDDWQQGIWGNFSNTQPAAPQCSSERTRVVECLDYKGRIITASDSRYVSHCNEEKIGSAIPATTEACQYPCPPPVNSGGDGSGGHSYNSDTGEMENTGSPAEN